jgi:hypothetical protein
VTAGLPTGVNANPVEELSMNLFDWHVRSLVFVTAVSLDVGTVILEPLYKAVPLSSLRLLM